MASVLVGHFRKNCGEMLLFVFVLILYGFWQPSYLAFTFIFVASYFETEGFFRIFRSKLKIRYWTEFSQFWISLVIAGAIGTFIEIGLKSDTLILEMPIVIVLESFILVFFVTFLYILDVEGTKNTATQEKGTKSDGDNPPVANQKKS